MLHLSSPANDDDNSKTAFLRRDWAEASGPGFTREVLQRLGRRQGAFQRYEVEEKVDYGGQGDILRVWDEDLLRHLAMKVLRNPAEPREGADEKSTRTLGRFLEEAQVTGQLDHPGIVPVHELGLDPSGRAYFTMKYVRGVTLHEVFRRVHAGDTEETVTRVLGYLLKVCEAMSYAHAKRVLHRDLKPSNVMVGRYGEVYVMDWGLSRLLDTEDHKDVRIRRPRTVSVELRSDRHECSGGQTPGSPLVTMDGDVVGTPSYMPPEQARGDLEHIGPAADVYSVGAMIYHLLAGHAPFQDLEEGEQPRNNHEVWYLLLDGPPAPLSVTAPQAPAEVVAICERAMERGIEDRFGSMTELASNLRAYLEGRVVPAYRTGAAVELGKWIRRNRGFAVAIAAAVLLAVLGAVGIAISESRAARGARAGEARTQLLLDVQLGEDLLRRAELDLWPVESETVPAMDAWLAEVEPFLERAQGYRAELVRLRTRGTSVGPLEPELTGEGWAWEKRLESMREEIPEMYAELSDPGLPLLERNLTAATLPIFEREVPVLEELVAGARRNQTPLPEWHFDDEADRVRHDRLARIDRTAARLEGRDGWEGVGVVDQVRARRRAADDLREVSIDEWDAAWEDALASIADPEECPLYGGLVLEPQVGLVPLQQDVASGLWEFWHVLSGEVPEPDETGDYAIAPETGIVLVLLPGGDFRMGASADPADPRYDSSAKIMECEPRPAKLDPFFLSKYELTRAQWYRMTGTAPSEHWTGLMLLGAPRVQATNPVEHVSWFECEEVLGRYGLEIPTEAQWEHGARGGTDGPYVLAGEGAVNSRSGANDSRGSPGPDGHILHWPVDTSRPNPFGLYAVHGNVAEWCRDWHTGVILPGPGLTFPPTPVAEDGTGELLPRIADSKTRRGGSYFDAYADVRITSRYKQRPDYRGGTLGVRAARRIIE